MASRTTIVLGLAWVAVVLWPAGQALADCEEGVAGLVSSMAAMTDPHERDVVGRDLKQAQYELWEFDEVECVVALQHAARFMRREADAAAAPAGTTK